MSPSGGTIVIGDKGPFSVIFTSSMLQALSASRRKILLKPISTLFPSVIHESLSFAVPRDVTVEILMLFSSNIQRRGLLSLSVIRRDVLSILSIKDLTSTFTSVVRFFGIAAL